VKAREASRPTVVHPVDPWSTSEKKTVNLIVKADVSGSLEAIKLALEQLSTSEVEVKVMTAAVGQVTESDIYLAQTAGASVIGFNVGPDGKAKRLAEQGGVQISTYSIIYELIDAVKDMMSGMLEPEIVETRLGKAEVRVVFHIQKVGAIAGSFVLDGKVLRNATGRVTRAGEVLAEGKIATLKRFKDDVKEVSSGYECGIAVDGYKDVQLGDVIEVIEFKTIRRTIDGDVR
jgi:translation initiation factor IF-2